jgi:membrane protein insertase Oxa1/YidC/SpoIIIJ
MKVVLLPFTMRAKLGQMRQARLKPKLDELQKRHGTNKAKIQEETQKLYRHFL